MTTPGSGRSSIGVRVRPNADNFIRDLKAQMAAKRFTYWVDVKANMTPANKDIKVWANGALKTYKPDIPIGANMVPATQELGRWKNLQRGVKTNIPIGVDMTAAQRELTAWRQAAKRDLEIPVKLNVRDLDAALERAARRKVKVGADVDTDPVEKKLNGLFLPGGKFREIKPVVDADITKATAKLDQLKGKAKEAVKSELELDIDEAEQKVRSLRVQEAARKLGVTMEVDADPKKAELQLRLLRARVAAQRLELDVRTKKGSLERVFDGIKNIENRFGSLTVLRSLDLGPVTLGKPTGLVGTIATITTLAGIVPAAVTAVAALSDGFMRLAGAAAIVPGAIGTIAASLSAFTIATSGVGDTIGAMFDMWTEGASEQASTARRSLQAQNQYRNAIVDESKAQRDLADARHEALGEIRNLNNELRGAVLNEAQAILDAQKARDRYAQGLAEGFDSDTDRLQGLLDIAKADENVTNVRERNISLQERANKANRDGVEGSDRVVDALEAQTRAQQQAAQAMEAMASTQATGAMGKFNDLLAQLSPNAQQFVLTLAGMQGPLKAFRNDMQDILFQGLGPALEGMFNNLMPIIGPGMKQITEGLNQNILQVFDTLQSPDGKSIIERILGGTAETQQALTGLIDPLVRGVGTLVAAGTEHMPQVINLITELTERFANFIEEADRNGTLDTFMSEGIDAMRNLAEIGINLFKIINDLSTAFRGAFGQDIFTMLANMTGQLHDFLSSAEGQKKVNEYLQDARDLWASWKPFLEDLPELFKAISDAAKVVLDVVMPFLTGFANFAKEHPGLVQGFVTAWLGAKVLTGALTPVLGVLNGLLSAARAIPGVASALGKIPGVGPALAGPAPVAGPGAAPKPPIFGPGNLLGPAVAVASGTIGMALLIEAMNTPTPESQARRRRTLSNRGLGKLVELSPREWIEESPNDDDRKKRQQWVADNIKAKEDLDKDFQPPQNYMAGGYTPWPQQQGRPVLLHGKEYIQPADTTAYYGVDAMEAIHQRRVPKGLLQSFQGGGQYGPKPWEVYGPADPNNRPGGNINPAWQIDTSHAGVQAPRMSGRDQVRWLEAVTGPGSMYSRPWDAKGPIQFPGFYSGGYVDANGVWHPEEPTQTNAAAPTSAPGIIPTLTQGVASGVPQVMNTVTGLPGPAPGPTDAAGNPTYGVDTSGGTYTPSQSGQSGFNLFGFNIPIAQDPTRGWGPGGPPPGLGGGPDGFDIRRFGIGPGPPGSGPQDWMNFVGTTAGSFLSGLGSSLLQGALGFFGLEGITSSPLFQAATGLTEHFFNAPGFSGSTGNAQTNAQVGSLLDTYAHMPSNPAYPGVPTLPQVFDTGTGSAILDASGNPIAIASTATTGKPWEGSGVTAPAKGSEFVATHAQASGAQVVPNANIMAYLQQEAARFGLTSNPNYRTSEPGSQHAIGRALDLFGPPENRRAFLEWWHSDPSRTAATRMLIDDNNTDLEAYAGKAGVGPYGRGDHGDHIHAALEGVPVSAFLDGSMAGGLPMVVPTATPAAAPPAWGYTGPSNVADYSSWYPRPGNKGVPANYRPTPGKTGSSGPAILLPPGMAGTPGTNPLLTGFPGAAMPAGGPNVEKWRPVFARVLRKLGLPQEPWLTLGMKQLASESSGNQFAVNRSDSNAAKGTPSKGLMQVIDPTFRANLPAGFEPNIFNPESNIAAAIVYTLGKYGGPAGAWGEGHGYDAGGWLMPGRTIADNATGKPELVIPYDQLNGFYSGGLNRFLTSLPTPPKPPPPLPRGPVAKPIAPRPPRAAVPPPPRIAPPPPQAAPKPTVPPVVPTAPPPAPHGGTGAAPGPGGRVSNEVAYGPRTPTPALPEEGMHLHPAARKGIASAAATIGSLADTAAAAATFGATGGMGGALGGGMGGGAGGLSIGGLIQQGGKIVEDIANVGASFLVGNITGGTTANAYGVTQRGVNPTGGTRVIDASSNQYGDIYTNNLDDYFARVKRREDQQAQVGLGAWGR